jgi:Leucine-rich repeat (LRR) protein
MSLNPFHRSEWPRPIIHPEEYTGGERLCLSWDLGATSEKEQKTVIKNWCKALPGLNAVRWLDLWTHVTPPIFEAACQLRSLECLQIKWSNIRSLDPIRNLHDLKYLSIGSSTRVESIEPLAAVSMLEILHIENFKLITDFSPLAALTNLQTLTVTGSMWSKQNVGSIEPLAQMNWLKSLAIDTTNVKTIQPLAALTNLEFLGMGGRLPMEEYAQLSSRLPNTQCRWFKPYLDLSDSGIGHCKQCGNNARVILTGKPNKTMCRVCDATKVERHIQAFEAIRDATTS